MSTARELPRAAQGGFTMFEVVVTVGLLTIMVLIMEGTIEATRRAERRLDAVRRVTERGERITYELLDEVNSSHKLFGGDAIGLAYLDALDLTRNPIVPSARLPHIDEINPLAPDAKDDPHTGNALLFVREAAAAPAVADPATGATRHIDLYRFVCVYPRATTRRLILDPPIKTARDLIVWRSVRFANHAQLLEILDDDERRSVAADLVNRFGIDHTWDPNEPVDAAFFLMDGLGTLSASPSTSMLIDEDMDESTGGRLLHGNVQLARTNKADFHRRSLMTNDDPTVWAPDGFEVKIVGISGSRRVWMHLVVETPGGKGVVGVQAGTVIASPRDL